MGSVFFSVTTFVTTIFMTLYSQELFYSIVIETVANYQEYIIEVRENIVRNYMLIRCLSLKCKTSIYIYM